MISSESEGSSFFEGTYEDNVQSHVISIVVEDASSDNEEELARVREAYFCDTKRPIPTLQHAQDIEDPNGAFFTVTAKNKNYDILFYRGPYLPPPPTGPIVSDGVPNVETFNETVKTMMRNMGYKRA